MNDSSNGSMYYDIIPCEWQTAYPNRLWISCDVAYFDIQLKKIIIKKTRETANLFPNYKILHSFVIKSM